MGALDGSDIPIPAPQHNATDYLNRKGVFSIRLIALVDANCKFMFAQAGWPGSVHDSRAYTSTRLASQVATLPVDYHIVADSAFRLDTWLLKPYPDDGHLSVKHVNFNKGVSRPRVRVEMAFGRMKKKWPRLNKMDFALDQCPKLIVCCCILHNLNCESDNECEDDDLGRIELDEEKQFNLDDADDDGDGDEKAPEKREAKNKRDRLMNDFIFIAKPL